MRRCRSRAELQPRRRRARSAPTRDAAPTHQQTSDPQRQHAPRPNSAARAEQRHAEHAREQEQVPGEAGLTRRVLLARRVLEQHARRRAAHRPAGAAARAPLARGGRRHSARHGRSGARSAHRARAAPAPRRLRAGRAALFWFQAKVSICAQGVPAAHELVEIERGGDRAGEAAFGDVVDVGDRALEHLAIGLPQRQAPQRIALRRARRAADRRRARRRWQNSAGRSGPSAMRAAPVSVAMSMSRAGFSLQASASASHRMSRPSASVLPTSTVMPLRVVMMSSGRKALPETEFSTAGTSTRSRTGSFAAP